MIEDSATRELIAQRAVGTPLDAYQSLLLRFDSESEPDASRLRAAEFLQLLTPGIVRVLKSFVEADEKDAFSEAFRSWNRRRRLHSFDRIEDLQFQRDHSDGDRRAALDRELAAARPLLDALQAVRISRVSALLQLGGWIAGKARSDQQSAERYAPFLTSLVGEFTTDPVVSTGLVIAALNSFFSGRRFDLLESWHSDEMLASGASSWSGDRSENGIYFAALLLLLLTGPDAAVTIPPTTNVGWAHEQMKSALDAVLQDRSVWAPLLTLPEDLEARRSNLESGWIRAEQERREIDRRRVAEADLAPERVDAFREKNQAVFFQGQTVARALEAMDCLHRVEDNQQFEEGAGRVIRQFVPKEWFVDDGEAIMPSEELGREMARDQDEVLADQLRNAAPRGDPGVAVSGIEGLAQAVREQTTRAGSAPLLLAPDDFRLREALFSWDGFELGRPTDHFFGRLAGAEVLMVGHDHDAPIVLLDGNQIQLTEYLVEGTGEPLRVVVQEIDRALATTSIEGGFEFRDEPEASTEKTIERLMNERVLLDVRASVRLDFDATAAVAYEWKSRDQRDDPPAPGPD